MKILMFESISRGFRFEGMSASLADADGRSKVGDHLEAPLKTLAILGLVLLCGVAANYARASFSPLQEAIRVGLSLTDNQIALVQGIAVALPISLAAFPLSLVVDRGKRVRLLLTFAVINLLGTLLTAVSTNFAMLFLARGLVGLGAFGTGMTIPSLISDLCTPATRGRALSLSGIGYVIGRSIAFAAGGTLLGGKDGWQSVMLWLSVPLIAVVIVALLLREPPRGEVMEAGAARQDRLVEFWRYRGTILPILVGFVVVEMADAAALIWAAPIFARNFSLSAAHVGSLMGMVLLCSGIAGMFAGGMLADFCQRRGGNRRAIFLMSCLALLSVPASCFALAPSPLLASVLLALLIMVGSILAIMSSAVLVVAIPNELRGLSMGAAIFGNTVFCIALAPLLVSTIASVIGGPSPLAIALSAVCVSTSLVGAVVLLKGARSAQALPTPQPAQRET